MSWRLGYIIIKISNKFAALENLSCSEDINRARENIKERIKTSAKQSLGLCELKRYIPWFEEECLCFLNQRPQAKMQWLQDSNQSSVDNLHNVRPHSVLWFSDFLWH
jgi:hypothetical protein